MAVPARQCKGTRENGERCRSAPVVESHYCFWHDPDSAEAAAEARRLGGIRRRRERTVAGAYNVDGLGGVQEIRRLIEVAVTDTLSLENSVARNRTLAYLATTAAKLLETGELEDRVAALEAVTEARNRR